MGVKAQGETINMIRFADVVAIVADNETDLKSIKLRLESSKTGEWKRLRCEGCCGCLGQTVLITSRFSGG